MGVRTSRASRGWPDVGGECRNFIYVAVSHDANLALLYAILAALGAWTDIYTRALAVMVVVGWER